jgi:hypothetical protein
VLTDIEATRDEGQRRLDAAEPVWKPTKDHEHAAHAIVTGTGICFSFSQVVLRNMGNHMLPGEDVRTFTAQIPESEAASEDTTHVFVIARPGGSEEEKQERKVVLDAWANGPAVRLRDSAYSQLDPAPEGQRMGPEAVRATEADMRRAVQEMRSAGQLKEWTDNLIRERVRVAEDPELVPREGEAYVWPESHVLSKELLQKASEHFREN